MHILRDFMNKYQQFTVLILISLSNFVSATVVTYPALTNNLYKSTRYTVSVNQSGVNSDSYVYNSVNTFSETTGNNRSLMTDENNFSSFSFDGSVTVTITLPLRTTAITAVDVLPLNKGITATWSGNTITIPIAKTGNYYVRINGEEKKPLFLFANPLEVNAPLASGNANTEYFTPSTFVSNFVSTKTIWYFAPGVYDAGSVGGTLQNIPSGVTVYLAGGAYVKGLINAAASSTSLTVKGRGILSGISVANVPDLWGNFLIGGGSSNLTVLNLEGITLTDPPSQLCLTYKSGSVIDNVKLFGWYVMTDGLTLGQTSTVKNCFLKTNDDPLKPMNSNSTYKDNVVWVQVFGSALQFSWNTTAKISNILVDGLDIIGFDKGNLTGTSNNASVISFQNMNGSTFSNNTVQNIRSDVKVYKIFNVQIKSTQTGFTQGLGSIASMTFKNLSFPMGQKYLSTFDGNGTQTGDINNITFQDVVVVGNLLTSSNVVTYITISGLTSNFLYTTSILTNFSDTYWNSAKFQCVAHSNRIFINDLNIGDEIKIYTMDGKFITSQKAVSQTMSIASGKGAFIVRNDNQAAKIIVY